MKVEILALADHAAEYGGKLCLTGIFDTLLCSQLPAVHPHCSLAVKLRIEAAEAGAKRLRILVSDPEGQATVAPVEVPIRVTVAPEATNATVQMVVNFSGLRLTTFGEHTIALEVEGRKVATAPLIVRRTG
jgi:hypothetical protein